LTDIRSRSDKRLCDIIQRPHCLRREFRSVVDAVRCAVEVQRDGLANAAAPAERRIEFRMGIDLGDIIIDAGAIFGDKLTLRTASKPWLNLAAFLRAGSCAIRVGAIRANSAFPRDSSRYEHR
jgi:hypothetical protein